MRTAAAALEKSTRRVAIKVLGAAIGTKGTVLPTVQLYDSKQMCNRIYESPEEYAS